GPDLAAAAGGRLGWAGGAVAGQAIVRGDREALALAVVIVIGLGLLGRGTGTLRAGVPQPGLWRLPGVDDVGGHEQPAPRRGTRRRHASSRAGRPLANRAGHLLGRAGPPPPALGRRAGRRPDPRPKRSSWSRCCWASRSPTRRPPRPNAGG